MKVFRFSKITAVAMLTGAPLLWSACTDTWDDHYNAQTGVMAGQGSILEAVKADPNLANFLDVVEHIGGAPMLEGQQQFTLWAPLKLSKAQADSIKAVYDADVNAGIKQEDNRAFTQFLQNHMAQYARPVSSLTDDTIKMLNDKYMALVGKSSTSGSLVTRGAKTQNPFEEVEICRNGILYKVANLQNFFPNVREYLSFNKTFEGMHNYIKSYDEYILDESASVAGGIKDGKTIYLDSVTILSNGELSRFGKIHREDSVYTLVAPTAEVWERELEQYKTYFNYEGNYQVSNPDSLRDLNAYRAVICGRFFNTSKNWAYNFNDKDSLCNTMYYEAQIHWPRKNVYYNPYGENGILHGLESFECSNGKVYIDNKGVIDPKKTFLSRLHNSGTSGYKIPVDASNHETMDVKTQPYEIYDTIWSVDVEGNPLLDEETGEQYYVLKLRKTYYYSSVDIKSNQGAETHTQLTYSIPSTLSNIYYNVYVVTCPVAEELNTWMQVSMQDYNPAKKDWNNPVLLRNPHPVSAETKYRNQELILEDDDEERGRDYCFVCSDEKMDTILVAKALRFDACGEGNIDATVKLTVGSWQGLGATTNGNGVLYTRKLGIQQFILVPFIKKSEAEEAADDLDAFNDAILVNQKY